MHLTWSRPCGRVGRPCPRWGRGSEGVRAVCLWGCGGWRGGAVGNLRAVCGLCLWGWKGGVPQHWSWLSPHVRLLLLQDLQDLADSWMTKRRAGLVQGHSSGFGGSGFKFDTDEADKVKQVCTGLAPLRQPGNHLKLAMCLSVLTSVGGGDEAPRVDVQPT